MFNFEELFYLLAEYGVLDVFLPFLLVFVISYSALLKLKMFDKKVKIVVAVAVATMTVAPHVLFMDVLYDPVDIINTLLPSVGAAVVFLVLIMFLLALMGKKFDGKTPSLLIIAVFAFLFYVLGTTLDWWVDFTDFFYWWPDWLTSLLVVGGTMYVLFSWIFGDDKKESKFLSGIKDMFGEIKKW